MSTRQIIKAVRAGAPLPELSALALEDLFRVFRAALAAGAAPAAEASAAAAQAQEAAADPSRLAGFFAGGMRTAAAAGSLQGLELAAAHFEAAAGRGLAPGARRMAWNSAMAVAAQKGDTAAMAWCAARGAAGFNLAMIAAAAAGRLAAMEWCRERGAAAFGRAMAAAAARGRFAAMAWCQRHGAANFAECAKAIAKASPGTQLKFREGDRDLAAPRPLCGAKGAGRKEFLAALKWCLSSAGWRAAARAAGQTGRVDVIDWTRWHYYVSAKQVEAKLAREFVVGAAESGSAKAVEWTLAFGMGHGERFIDLVGKRLPGAGPARALFENALKAVLAQRAAEEQYYLGLEAELLPRVHRALP